MANRRILTCLMLLGIYVLFFNIDGALGQEPQVMFLDLEQENYLDTKGVQLACDLLGIKVRVQFVGEKDKELQNEFPVLGHKDVLIVTGRALGYLDQNLITHLENRGEKAKILILDITPTTDKVLLKKWSEGMIKECRPFDIQTLAASIKVTKRNDISFELGDMEQPLIGDLKSFGGFELDDPERVAELMTVLDADGKVLCPVFVKCDSMERSVFFLSSIESILGKGRETGQSVGINGFVQIAPILMFLKHSFGDRCWHSVNDYANLTIDDPWLREPYGHLRFTGLCNEAKKARFHATIGFIPYNFNRSENDAVTVFRECRENLSLSVHGNNHDFREFERAGDHLADEMRILQAAERMNMFQGKTGVAYDRVMIFPRGIFTSDSLKLLKEQNFLMTVNATSGPVDVSDRKSDVDEMRGLTLDVRNFPMVKRAMLPQGRIDRPVPMMLKSWIAMRFFLDLPVLLATHHDYFKNGMDAFNPVADAVNRAQPEVVWASLGEIARRLYFQRRITERHIEIQAFSSHVMIRNTYPFEMKFKVRKQEDFSIPIEAVKVDGEDHEFHREDGDICVDVAIAPGFERGVQILYGGPSQAVSIDASESDLEATVIRFLSDFRDNTLSRSPYTDKAVVLFYGLGGVKGFGLGALGMIGLGLLVCIRHVRGRKRAKHPHHPT